MPNPDLQDVAILYSCLKYSISSEPILSSYVFLYIYMLYPSTLEMRASTFKGIRDIRMKPACRMTSQGNQMSLAGMLAGEILIANFRVAVCLESRAWWQTGVGIKGAGSEAGWIGERVTCGSAVEEYARTPPAEFDGRTLARPVHG